MSIVRPTVPPIVAPLAGVLGTGLPWESGGGGAALSAPTIVISGTRGVGMNLTATITGSPTPTVRWQRGATFGGGGSWSDIGGATSTTYTMVSADIGYDIRCLASNAVQADVASNTSAADTLSTILGASMTMLLDQRDQTLVSNALSAWGDQSAAGTADLSQGSAGLRPDGTTTINSLAAPKWDGVDDYELLAIAWTVVIGTTGGRLLIVLDNTGITPGADDASIHNEPGVLCSTASTAYVLAWSSTGPRASAYDGSHHGTGRITASVGLHLLDLSLVSGSLKLKCDDTSATDATGIGTVSNSGSSVFGRNFNGTKFFGGKVGSVVGMTPDVSATAVTTARAFLKNKYAGSWTA